MALTTSTRPAPGPASPPCRHRRSRPRAVAGGWRLQRPSSSEEMPAAARARLRRLRAGCAMDPDVAQAGTLRPIRAHGRDDAWRSPTRGAIPAAGGSVIGAVWPTSHELPARRRACPASRGRSCRRTGSPPPSVRGCGFDGMLRWNGCPSVRLCRPAAGRQVRPTRGRWDPGGGSMRRDARSRRWPRSAPRAPRVPRSAAGCQDQAVENTTGKHRRGQGRRPSRRSCLMINTGGTGRLATSGTLAGRRVARARSAAS